MVTDDAQWPVVAAASASAAGVIEVSHQPRISMAFSLTDRNTVVQHFSLLAQDRIALFIDGFRHVD